MIDRLENFGQQTIILVMLSLVVFYPYIRVQLRRNISVSKFVVLQNTFYGLNIARTRFLEWLQISYIKI